MAEYVDEHGVWTVPCGGYAITVTGTGTTFISSPGTEISDGIPRQIEDLFLEYSSSPKDLLRHFLKERDAARDGKDHDPLDEAIADHMMREGLKECYFDMLGEDLARTDPRLVPLTHRLGFRIDPDLGWL